MKIPVLLLLLAAPAIASAQLYKWTGPDGKVNYSDTPPPGDARRAESRVKIPETSPDAALPYALQQAVVAHPVVLYTMPDCTPCDEGRALLARRGIPMTEKTVVSNQDIAALKALAGSNRLPLLAIGKVRQQGYEPNAWNQALTNAGYPAQSRLPVGWRNPAPTSLAPPAQVTPPQNAEAVDAPPSAPSASELPPPAGNAPPGFRF